ncbi:MAG: hypothetical protein SGBAC_011630 [Bacillariaceae sp.]
MTACTALVEQALSQTLHSRTHQRRLATGSTRKIPMKACAVLVDAENVPYSRLQSVLKRLETLGYKSKIKRVFGDFAKHSLCNWDKEAKKLAFERISAPTYVKGKGTSDAAMIVGAMDILHERSVIKCFTLVTSDSDFTSVVCRLRQSGKEVVGFGDRKTPSALLNECTKFIYFDTLKKEETKCEDTPKEKEAQHLVKVVGEVIDRKSDKEGWATLSSVGPHFDCKQHGYPKISSFFKQNTNHFRMNKKNTRVRNLLPAH